MNESSSGHDANVVVDALFDQSTASVYIGNAQQGVPSSLFI
jgi:hypothetical protein